ncbi:hypothetical protein C0991_007475 [Blastosporella zonata]|nr:hypothetical protein C0991_007475 [Blastosporella zonata]
MAKSKQQKQRQARARRAVKPEVPGPASFSQEQKRGGLLVTDELEKALQECTLQVKEIADDCKRKNRKFRDIEFDLELDKDRCLHGLREDSDEHFAPSDVQRVTQIFDKTVTSFFVDGADSNDIIQGQIGDCWFLSALATMSTHKGLVEKFCVARDETVGVYGFIFFRDTAWVSVIIDDLLFTSIPKFEELKVEERQLYHNDKEAYNLSARKSGKSMYFSRSGTNGETWVPLIEKAYAKLHGNYAALSGGQAGEAIEDLTGGVTSFIYTKDILDPDTFWTNELCHANDTRLFGCSFGVLDTERSGAQYTQVNGLFGGHAYSILRAVEHNGKRFVVIRNPWGRSEWTGPWSDGSKEWTPEWLQALPELKHTFGNDGQFLMEYEDFLENWEQIDRTRLFDSSWSMSSQWLKVTTRPLPSAWTYGDVSFTISLPEASSTVIVLSQLDKRFWKAISGSVIWTFDFIIYKKGENKPITTSSSSLRYSRSVNAEVDLEAGEYVVHVRLDSVVDHRDEDYEDIYAHIDWQERVYSRVRTEQVKSQTIASNFNAVGDAADYLPVSLDLIAGQDLSELETKAAERLKAKQQEAQAPVASIQTTGDQISPAAVEGTTAKSEETAGGSAPDSTSTETVEGIPATSGQTAVASVSDSTSATDTPGASASQEVTVKAAVAITDTLRLPTLANGAGLTEGTSVNAEGDKKEKPDEPAEDEGEGSESEQGSEYQGVGPGNKGSTEEPIVDSYDDEGFNIVYLGLRVYTKAAAPAKIGGQLRHTPLASLIGSLAKNNKSPELVV